MAKAYWIVCYHSIKNPDALAAYAKIAAPALQAAGGRYLVRGNPAKVYEAGLNQRTVVIEFDSVQKAIAAHDGAGYQESLKVLATRSSATCGSSRASAETTPALRATLLKRGGENHPGAPPRRLGGTPPQERRGKRGGTSSRR